MKTFKQRLMLVATLMVIAVSGYAQSTFHNLLEGDNTNFDGGTLGKWEVWGNGNNPKDLNPYIGIVEPGFDNKGKCLKLNNPNGTDFWHAQLCYEFSEYLEPSKEYTIKFKAKCENGSSQLQFQYQHHEGNTFEPQGGYQDIGITNQWTDIERKVTIANDHKNINRILINFGKYPNTTIYIDDIEFGSYETQDPGTDPGTGTTPGTTPTGSLNNTMYYDGTQWCLMLEDFEGETIGDTLSYKHEQSDDKDPGKAEVAADPHKKSKNSLNFVSGSHKGNDYYYIDVTLPKPKTLSESYFKDLIFDIVFNDKGDNDNFKEFKVNIGNTSTQLGTFKTEGKANTTSWSRQSFSLAGKYTNEDTFRIYIGGVNADHANMFIDNIRLSVQTTQETIGTCGSPTKTDVNWMLDGNTLYISGTGDIADYEESSSKLWSEKKDNISNVIIGEGITAIGKQNFYNHNGLESVVLPSTLKQIGEQGLYVNNGNNETKPTFTFHSNPTMGTNALHENSDYYTATLVLDDALSPFFAAKSDNTFNGGIQYKRTLSAEKSTITLPFTPKSGSENCKFYKLSSASEDNLTFEEVSKTNLFANKPYIMVKTEGSNEIDFSTDESITIWAKDSVASQTTFDNWTMHGNYSTRVIKREDSEASGYNAYGFTGDALKRNIGNMTVKPFRAYFTNSSDVGAKDYLDVIFGGVVTGIERNEFSPEGITEIFSLDGKKHDCLQKGMNIVKMNNGSIKKIVIK